MKDQLRDLVEHTFDLGCIEAIKISGTDEITEISAIADDRSVIVVGKFKDSIPEFKGVFGMPNLQKLKVILGIPEYKTDAEIKVQRQNEEPSGLAFRNKSGDFKNDYRFMTSEIVAEKLKSVKFRGASWNIEFVPSLAAIQRLKFQSQANSDELTFQARTENGDLKFFFGDHSTHAGNFVFHAGIEGELTQSWAWPVKQVMAILDLAGDKVMKISDQGATEITVDSGIGIYTYLLPAMSK
jgi:hypothetical protein